MWIGAFETVAIDLLWFWVAAGSSRAQSLIYTRRIRCSPIPHTRPVQPLAHRHAWLARARLPAGATCQDNGVLMLKFTNGAWPLPGSQAPPGQQN